MSFFCGLTHRTGSLSLLCGGHRWGLWWKDKVCRHVRCRAHDDCCCWLCGPLNHFKLTQNAYGTMNLAGSPELYSVLVSEPWLLASIWAIIRRLKQTILRWILTSQFQSYGNTKNNLQREDKRHLMQSSIYVIILPGEKHYHSSQKSRSKCYLMANWDSSGIDFLPEERDGGE